MRGTRRTGTAWLVFLFRCLFRERKQSQTGGTRSNLNRQTTSKFFSLARKTILGSDRLDSTRLYQMKVVLCRKIRGVYSCVGPARVLAKLQVLGIILKKAVKVIGVNNFEGSVPCRCYVLTLSAFLSSAKVSTPNTFRWTLV